MPRLLGPIGCAYTAYDLIKKEEKRKRKKESKKKWRRTKDRNCERKLEEERNDYLSKTTTSKKHNMKTCLIPVIC